MPHFTSRDMPEWWALRWYAGSDQKSCTILTVDHATLDLTRQAETEQWIDKAKPDAVILAAGKVGGIAFNNAYPVDFLSDNLAMALNVICASYAAGVKKLLFLGSSCIYPRWRRSRWTKRCY